MHFWKLLTFLIFSVGAACLAAAQENQPAPGAEGVLPTPSADAGKVIAKVGDKVVTEGELQQSIVRAARGMGHSGGAIDRARILQSCIDAKILESIVQSSGITVTDEEIDRFGEESAKRQTGAADLDAYLKSKNMTREQYRARVRPNLLLVKFMKPKMEEIRPSPEEVKAEYERLKTAGKMDRPEMVDISRVLVTVPEGADKKAEEEAKKKIEAARKRIVDGKEDFAKVAKEVSEDPLVQSNGGSIQNVAKVPGAPPEFLKGAFETPVGEVSKPFMVTFDAASQNADARKTKQIWQIVRVDAKRAAGTMTLEETGGLVADSILSSRRDEVVQRIIADAKKDIKIEILDPAASAGQPEEKKEDDPSKAKAPANESLIKSST
jgi:parvulin-like peptidyl-prolyl isomerase